MKRSEIVFGLLRIPLDFLGALGALVGAYWLRSRGIDLLPGLALASKQANLPALPWYLWHFAVPASLLFLSALAILRLYALKITVGPWQEIRRVTTATLLWLTLVMAWFFLVARELFFSRILLLQATILIAMLSIFGRILILVLQRWCLRRGIGVRTVVSAGGAAIPAGVRQVLDEDPRFVYIGHCESSEDVKEKHNQRPIDLLIHTDPNASSTVSHSITEYCRSAHIGYAFLPPIFLDVPDQLMIGHIGLTPVLHFIPTPLDGWGRVLKRILDVIGASVLLLLLLPLLIIIAVAVLCMSGLPIFYTSTRIGQYGRKNIRILKFRTMVNDADARKKELLHLNERKDGPLFKLSNDPRVTSVGRVLRRLSLDELPQLLSVLTGDLSLVGPRPHLPEEVARYDARHRRVLTVRPGITGLAQISGRSSLTFEDEVRLDLRYIEDWSLGLDLWILWRTVFVVVLGKDAN